MNKHSYAVSWVSDSLAVGQAPMSYDALHSLKEQGIGAILNLCAEFCDLHWIEADAGFEVYYFPIPDEEAPDLQELEKALDWLDECLYLGKKVLIHCRFGIGRTGTVVNAFLLRKGLGHKLAGKKLQGLKSKPSNFNQWWFIRKYGKKEKQLTIREPSLETKNIVDLFPFFADFENLLQELDSNFGSPPPPLCGRSHSRCCRELVTLSFIEAVYINHIISAHLGRMERQGIVERAVAAMRTIKGMQSSGAAVQDADFLARYKAANLLCPLNEYAECLIFAHRPVACRTFDLSPEQRQDLAEKVPKSLDELSRQVYFAFTSSFSETGPLSFLLPEVASGKFVQVFFHQLTAGE